MALICENLLTTLECSICLQLLNDPKLLSCGHTFCRECIDGTIASSPTSWSIKCPNCRSDTIIPHCGLSTNYVIKDVISKMENLEVKMKEVKPSKIPCFECRKRFEHEDAFICKTCSFENVPHSSKAVEKKILCAICALIKHKEHDVHLLANLFTAKQRQEMIIKLTKTINLQYENVKVMVENNFQHIDELFTDQFINCQKALYKISQIMETPLIQDAFECEKDALNIFDKFKQMESLFEKFRTDMENLFRKETFQRNKDEEILQEFSINNNNNHDNPLQNSRITTSVGRNFRKIKRGRRQQNTN